eukprot:CAMPEP_0197822890 /NCGR_PEP_ID=MMETSP1437-20131217/196_1 /TAXON_ID=49252 ORGANISM="Eucampia antarctica, Strain CCMP1452" /NCGR_SAMPLE_ID=MMETSP1437 /ASSEMBLY_ACC=CAM_ASM_001096 /LENGTH=366 /DNA_ID=CAMNT_0043421759 /DNA_START=54 /DNA_END=1154 /DNA_ORIENTATION=-
MATEIGAYTAVPIQIESDASHLIENKKSVWRLLMFLIPGIITITVVAIPFLRQGLSESPSVTLLDGGGRDWILDQNEGIISPKNNTEFALGALEFPPLILTERDADNVIRFDKQTLSALSKGDPQELKGIGLESSTEHNFENAFDFILTSSAPDASLTLKYKDSNFLVLEDMSELVLDISFGKYMPGNTVNFLRAQSSSPFRTFQSGGGRDWILDLEEGIISPKHEPKLALGRGFQQLQLHKRGTKGVWKFDNLDKLINGEPMKLVNTDGLAMGKKLDRENIFDIWRYIQSAEVEDPKKAISIKYIEDNFLAIYEEDKPEKDALVLDVSFWKMFEFNSVNYVGGWCYANGNCDDEAKLRKDSSKYD